MGREAHLEVWERSGGPSEGPGGLTVSLGGVVDPTGEPVGICRPTQRAG